MQIDEDRQRKMYELMQNSIAPPVEHAQFPQINWLNLNPTQQDNQQQPMGGGIQALGGVLGGLVQGLGARGQNQGTQGSPATWTPGEVEHGVGGTPLPKLLPKIKRGPLGSAITPDTLLR